MLSGKERGNVGVAVDNGLDLSFLFFLLFFVLCEFLEEL
jgi:hypothetical protein